MRTVLLLLLSNTFMTIAWYGHLRYKSAPLVVVILASWLIALPEYALQVPANRFGHGRFTAAQLKIIQEVISLCAFLGFSVIWLRESPTHREFLAMMLVIAAVALAIRPRVAPTRMDLARRPRPTATQTPMAAERPTEASWLTPQSGQSLQELDASARAGDVPERF